MEKRSEYLLTKMENKSGGKLFQHPLIVTRYFWMVPLICGACLLVAYYNGSRAFFIGYAASLFFVWVSSKKFKLKNYVWLISILSFVGLTIMLAVVFKSDSSLGRLFILKISSVIFLQHYLTGIGFGNFEKVYGHYQADYFKTADFTQKELLLADNTYYAFNDYAQFIVECGIPGIILLIILFISIGYGIKRAFRNCAYSPPPILFLACAQLIAISISAMFTHVFEKTLYQYAVLVCMAIILYYAIPISKEKFYHFLGMMLVTISAVLYLHFSYYINHYQAYVKWKEASLLASTGYKTKAIKLYDELFNVLQHEPEFLINYGTTLLAKGNALDAKQVFEKAIALRTSNTLYLQLGHCYFRTGELQKAEEAYLKAVYIVPNRFETRYALFNFYDKTQEIDKMILWGNSIKALPVKVPSLQVILIKEMVANRLESMLTINN